MTYKARLPFLEARLPTFLEDLRRLVSIDSGSHDKAGNDAVVDWLQGRLEQLGWASERISQPRFGDDLFATRPGRGKGRIMLLGHTDTVFPRGTAAQRPMAIEGGKLLGPGTCDMKAGLLSGLLALEALASLGFDGYESLSFLCVSDEEINSERHSVPLIRAYSRKADVVLTLEAARANGDIVSSRKGMCWYLLEATGKAAHAGVEPEKGRNAIVALTGRVLGLTSLNGLEPGLTVNVGTIQGGRAPNIVPDWASIRVDVRAWSEGAFRRFEQAVREQLAQEALGVSISFGLEENSYVAPLERTVVVAELERLAQEEARALGFELKGASAGGCSDASYAAGEGAAVLDGLGPIGGLDHGPDEYVELGSIVPRTALLANLIIAYCQKRALTEAGPEVR